MFPDFEILKNAKLIAKMAPNKHFLTKLDSIETDNHMGKYVYNKE